MSRRDCGGWREMRLKDMAIRGPLIGGTHPGAVSVSCPQPTCPFQTTKPPRIRRGKKARLEGGLAQRRSIEKKPSTSNPLRANLSAQRDPGD